MKVKLFTNYSLTSIVKYARYCTSAVTNCCTVNPPLEACIPCGFLDVDRLKTMKKVVTFEYYSNTII